MPYLLSFFFFLFLLAQDLTHVVLQCPQDDVHAPQTGLPQFTFWTQLVHSSCSWLPLETPLHDEMGRDRQVAGLHYA